MGTSPDNMFKEWMVLNHGPVLDKDAAIHDGKQTCARNPVWLVCRDHDYAEAIGKLRFSSADAIALYDFFAQHTPRTSLKLLPQNRDSFRFVTSAQVKGALDGFAISDSFKKEDNKYDTNQASQTSDPSTEG